MLVCLLSDERTTVGTCIYASAPVGLVRARVLVRVRVTTQIHTARCSRVPKVDARANVAASRVTRTRLSSYL